MFLSHRDIYIEEIGPSGFISFVMLVGVFEERQRNGDVSQQIGIHGSYLCQAYGNMELKKLKKWIPMNDEGKISKLKNIQFLYTK